MVVSMVVVRAFDAIEGGANQFAIRKTILIRGGFDWHGFERIFQNAPPTRWAGKIPQYSLEIVAPEV
jgi:hypothetical protein